MTEFTVKLAIVPCAEIRQYLPPRGDVKLCPRYHRTAGMNEGEVTLWLQEHGRATKLNVELARRLARESHMGWYVAPHSHNRFAIGKLTLAKISSRHIVTDAAGNALTFDSVAEAKKFLQDEFGIDGSQVFGY